MMRFLVVGRMPRVLGPRDLSRLARILDRLGARGSSSIVAVRIVSPRVIREMNKRYRRHDRVTDVLSFGTDPAVLPDQEPATLGDLVICPSFATTEAKRRGISPREELLRLLAHGVLHLAGFDHATPKDEMRMFKKQEEAIAPLVKSDYVVA